MSQTGERWRPFTSRQRMVTRRPSFVWDGWVSMAAGLDVHVHNAYVDGKGLLDNIRAEARGRVVGERIIPTPWEGRMSNNQQRDGLLIPVDREVAWLMPEGQLPYWHGTISELGYHR